MVEVVNLKTKYTQEAQPALMEEFGISNAYAAAALRKIVVNVGVGRLASQRRAAGAAKSDEELVRDIREAFALICGQQPQIIRSRRSISGFKLRAGQIVGLRTTLRQGRMYDFLARFIRITLPRTRDFRGIPLKSVDKNGNLTVGIRDYSVFPEAPQMNVQWGLEVTMVPTKYERDEAIALYRALGVPLQKDES